LKGPETFESNILAMRNLHIDTEREFLSFNRIIPYNINPAKVYSPRLYRILQGASSQIIAMMHLIYDEYNPKLNRQKEFPFYFEHLNKTNILSIQKVAPREQFNLILRHFHTDKKEKTPKWWQEYNDTKHDLPRGAYNGKLGNVLNALAALALLHDIADLLMGGTNVNRVLDSGNWLDISSEFLHDYERLLYSRATSGILYTANRGFYDYKSSLFYYLFEYHPKATNPGR
jgi:hypothetical protein